MTCIAAVAHKGKVYMAGDSAGVAGLDLTVRKDAKVFTVGPYLIGYTSSFRMGQLIRYAFKAPDPPRDAEELHGFLCTTWINALRTSLKEGGYATKEDGAEMGGNFLVGIKGRLFNIENDFQVGEARDGYDAVGCGDNYAKGSLHSTKGMEPRERLKLAMEAAEHHSAGVRRPFTFATT